MKLDMVGYNRVEVMARPETPQGTHTGQDTAAQTVPEHQQTLPPPDDTRIRSLYPSELNQEILGNPTLYIGRADF